jgi:hypothetical protein
LKRPRARVDDARRLTCLTKQLARQQRLMEAAALAEIREQRIRSKDVLGDIEAFSRIDGTTMVTPTSLLDALKKRAVRLGLHEGRKQRGGGEGMRQLVEDVEKWSLWRKRIFSLRPRAVF